MTTASLDRPAERLGLLSWWREGTDAGRKALVAASMGWALDAFDVMLFSLTLASVIADLGLTKSQAGILGSVTLLGGAAGGLIFGHVADRFGRTRALMASVLIYSVFTAACGLSQNLWQFAVMRACLGLGMGGEWASGAALVSETWPARLRGRALGFMQGSWAIGFAVAAMVVGFMLPRYGWRAVFFVGVLPALFVFWVRRNVEEPEVWVQRQRNADSSTSPGLTNGVIPSGARSAESRNLHVPAPSCRDQMYVGEVWLVDAIPELKPCQEHRTRRHATGSCFSWP
jgi:MFS family permease